MLSHFYVDPLSVCLIGVSGAFMFSCCPKYDGVQEPCGEATNHSEHSFPLTCNYRDIFTQGCDSRPCHSHKKFTYSRFTVFQWILCYLCDYILGTTYLDHILPTVGSASKLEYSYDKILPVSFSTETYRQCIEYTKLSFCKVKDVIEGIYYRDGVSSIVDIPSNAIRVYQPFQTQVYGMRGYFLLHRKKSLTSNRTRLVIAFHASRNKATSRASCMVGLHRCDFCFGCQNSMHENQCFVYLGWYATFISLVPQIEDILKDILDFVEERDQSKTRSHEKEVPVDIEEIIITGSCMGGSIANLAAVYVHHWLRSVACQYLKESWDIPGEQGRRLKAYLHQLSEKIHVYTFGSPRVGNTNFARYYNHILGNNTYRIVNEGDGKVRLPLASMGFTHCGQETYFSYEQQKLAAGKPRFSNSSSHKLEDPHMGTSVSFWRALAPPLRQHAYYSNTNIMKCN